MLSETTNVPVERTVIELTAELVKVGARTINTQYNDLGIVIGMQWILRIDQRDIWFAMPARVDAVYAYLRSRMTGHVNKEKLQAKAERIAWRHLLRWVQAQNAMIQTGMMQAHEVYLPYATTQNGKTMFQVWSAQLALPAAAKETK
jgi:hypothetical protein